MELQEQTPSPDDAIMPQERRFRVGDREVVLRPLPIGRYREMWAALGEIAQRIIREHPGIDLERPEEHLQHLIPIAGEWLSRIVATITGVDAEYLEEHMTLAQATEIVVAALELNQLPVIRGNLLRARELLAARATA